MDDYDIILSQLPNLQPVVAKRHFHKTGTQRIFQRFCLVLTNVKKTVEEIVRLDISNVSAGAFIFLCKTKEDSQQDFENKILSNPERKECIYNKICETLVMAYKTDSIGIDDIEIGDDDVPTG